MNEKNTIVVRGGDRSEPLPPAREFDGKPDPELQRMAEEGAKRYHLDTLKTLDAESRFPAPVSVESKMKSLSPVRLLSLSTAMLMAGVGMAPVTREVLGLDPGESDGGSPLLPLDEIERVRLEGLGRELARSAIANRDLSQEDGARLDSVLEKPCRSAACRTLKECLCTCKRCKLACSRRRS